MESNELKDDELWQRIAKIRHLFCNGKNIEFAAKIGKDTTYTSQLCNGSKPAGKKMLEIILDAFPEVSRQWLYFGEGEMMVNDYQVNNQSNVTVGGDNIVNGSTKTTAVAESRDLMEIIRSQQKTIQDLTEQNKKLTEIIANKL
ncbi:MAG: hypothetical protein IJT61_03980 [Bacteroidales bacterium]|nr:hypothetical protein [Bacteroidales bacterium]